MNYFDVLLAKKLEDDRDPKVEGLSVSANGRYHEDGVVYDPVIVNVPETPLSKLTVTENGTYTAPSGTAYNEVEVDVPLPENAYLLKDIPNTPTAIATFTDGADLPMPKLEVGIEPVQEGSGDPSPENIRPISGWDEVNVGVSGVNVWDEEWVLGTINDNTGQDAPETGIIRSVNYIPIVRNTAFYFKTSNSTMRVFKYRADKSYIGYENVTNNTLTFDGEVYFIRFRMYASYGTTYNNDISINYPSTDTSYHAYLGHTYTIDLDGTRYGGTLDLVSGVLTVDWAMLDLGNLNYTKNATYPNIFNTTLAIIAKNTLDAICEIYTLYDSQTLSQYDYGFAISAGLSVMYIKNKDYAEIDDFKTAMNGVKVVYKLATPITYQLPTTVVKSLRGENNISADSGNILDLSYLAKEE